jgi:mannan endo-1,4-beta-mannosidase
MKAAGLTFVRTWGFNDRTSPQEWGAYYQLFQNGQQTFNTGANGISRFDSVVRAARASGVKLIVALTNNWSDYGGMDTYVSALGCGNHGGFYTHTNCITGFQNYIRNFVGRYKDEPAIMGWELANEPRCGGSNGGAGSCTPATITQWARTMSQFVKSIDSNHIVALGDEGFYQGGDSSGGYPYNANEGIDFVENLKIASLDFGTVHMYPDVSAHR